MTTASFFGVYLALGAPSGQGQNNLPPWAQLVPFLLLFAVMYLVLILPQQKKEKQRGLMLKALKVGDKVVTTSGIVGVVVGIRELHVTLRSEDAKFELLKSAIQEVTERKA